MTAKKKNLGARKSKPVKPGSGVTITDGYGNAWSRVVTGTDKELRAAEAALGMQIPDDVAPLFKGFGAGRPARDFYFDPTNNIEVSIGMSCRW